MQKVRFREAVKLDDPYVIVGDAGGRAVLEDDAAFWASTQGLVHIEGAPDLQAQVAPALPSTLRHLDDDSPVERALDEVPEPLKRPYGNAPKSSWIAYAMSVDPELTLERAQVMSKNDLMSQHGERL